jgi:hypothetical protein
VLLAGALIPWLRLRSSRLASSCHGLMWAVLLSVPLLHGCGGGGGSSTVNPLGSSSSGSSSSSSSSSSGGSSAGTPAGNYSVTVTATGGSVTQGLQYQLTVQ